METQIDNRRIINVDPADWDRISKEAFERSISRSELVRRIVRAYLDGNSKTEPDAGPARGSIRRRDASIT